MLHQFEHVIQCPTVEQGPMNKKITEQTIGKRNYLCKKHTFLVAATKKRRNESMM